MVKRLNTNEKNNGRQSLLKKGRFSLVLLGAAGFMEWNRRVNLPPTTLTVTASEKQSRRKFVSYTSSAWERLWLDNVTEWTDNQEICQVLLEDPTNRAYMLDFLDMICTSSMTAPHEDWCIMDDEYQPLFYNSQKSRASENEYFLFFHSESPFKDTTDLQSLRSDNPNPIRPGPQHEHIVSKFVFLDEVTGEEYVEYIEPLVSHLRFPLAKCLPTQIWPIPYGLFRGYVIPPPRLFPTQKAVYFDAGASSWSTGGGGPSLKFFVNIWKRHGIDFQDIFAYEMTTKSEDFYQDVPSTHKDRTHYKQCAVSSSPKDETAENPFIPHEIQNYKSKRKDEELYVLFKLDIDSPLVEQGSIDYLLEQGPGIIHELAWEHHVDGNYLMKPAWSGPAGIAHLSLKQSYHLFLWMRQLGIRAHSWV